MPARTDISRALASVHLQSKACHVLTGRTHLMRGHPLSAEAPGPLTSEALRLIRMKFLYRHIAPKRAALNHYLQDLALKYYSQWSRQRRAYPAVNICYGRARSWPCLTIIEGCLLPNSIAFSSFMPISR
jgi:hypothetical protein